MINRLLDFIEFNLATFCSFTRKDTAHIIASDWLCQTRTNLNPAIRTAKLDFLASTVENTNGTGAEFLHIKYAIHGTDSSSTHRESDCFVTVFLRFLGTSRVVN